MPLIDKYDNLLVVRTYSKSRSMAGMRIGYAMGNPALIQAMKDVKESINSYTMNTESILIGAASLEDEEYFRENIKKVMNTRAKTKEELEKLGFDVKESCTNFLLRDTRMFRQKKSLKNFAKRAFSCAISINRVSAIICALRLVPMNRWNAS